MKVNAITLRPGNVLDRNNKLWVILKSEIMQPGKGASVIQLEMRDIRGGNKDNVRYRTQETVERITLEQDDYQFLYEGTDGYEFMHLENYEQVLVNGDVIGSPKSFLQEGMKVQIESHEGIPLGVKLPDTVIMEVKETEPVIKGQTASSSYKPAILDNDIRVMVPPHIGVGSKIVVKTEDSSYSEKAK